MKRLRKAWRITCLVALLLLASIGVSLGAGVPVPSNRRNDYVPEIRTELVESERKDQQHMADEKKT